MSKLFSTVFIALLFLAYSDSQGVVYSPPEPPALQYYSIPQGGGVAPASETGTIIATNETEATPEIESLARGLLHDPKLIYDYVRNHIEYIPNFGIRNGATGCLLAGRGTDWDQSALLASLLRESGYTNRFVKCEIGYSMTDLSNWSGVETNYLVDYFGSGGVRVSGIYGYPDQLRVERVWVEANINGTWYTFDPR